MSTQCTTGNVRRNKETAGTASTVRPQISNALGQARGNGNGEMSEAPALRLAILAAILAVSGKAAPNFHDTATLSTHSPIEGSSRASIPEAADHRIGGAP